MIPRWSRQDEIHLRERVRRMATPPAERPHFTNRLCDFEPQPPTYSCVACRDGDHSHDSWDVGPFLICRCLGCPVVVVEPEHEIVVGGRGGWIVTVDA